MLTVENKEVLSGEDATIACKVSGLTKKLDAVKWNKPGGADVLSDNTNYVVNDGTYETGSQTTTLTVKSTVNTVDSTYTCVITSLEWEKTDIHTDVTLNVFSKFYTFKLL